MVMHAQLMGQGALTPELANEFTALASLPSSGERAPRFRILDVRKPNAIDHPNCSSILARHIPARRTLLPPAEISGYSKHAGNEHGVVGFCAGLQWLGGGARGE